MRPSESELGAAFCAAVPYALPHVRIFRRQIVNAETKAGWRARAGLRGQADYYALVRGGRHIEIELKQPKHRWLPAQVAWQGYCERERIPYLVLQPERGESPADTITRWLHELRVVAA